MLTVVFAALMGAIVWNLLTWWWGLPVVLVARAGGRACIGATIPALGVGGLMPSGILKIVSFIVLSPVIGFYSARRSWCVTAWIVRGSGPAKVDGWFRRLQLVSAAIFSYSHGTNDAQKVMGIIAVILYGTIWTDRPST